MATSALAERTDASLPVQPVATPDHTLTPSPSRPLPSTSREKTPPTCILPYLESNKSKPEGGPAQNRQSLPPSGLSNSFLPPEFLQVLKQQRVRSTGVGEHAEPLAKEGGILPSSITKRQHKDGEPFLPSIHPPANVWNHPKRRSRFSHLTTHPPCVCGAGRDISFLHDVTENTKRGRQKSLPPDTLIPDEYHLSKHPGVMGLEFHEDKYTTQSENHEHHLTIFPSMKPAGRHEVITLKHTMDQMLERAGIPKEVTASHLPGPTEIHNLLELVRKEQAIYNMCFHELIRQVSVHCAERGELLQDIRTRYSNLLDHIPRQVMGLHNEVVAQRALDRRLISEVNKFKSRVAALTDRLAEVKEHDSYVTEQSRQAEEGLSSALVESEKNANLLAEYHDLYELQRARLEEQVRQLSEECDVWQGAAYGLAGRVAQAQQLRTIRRLQLGEKTWAKLARHFAIFLSDRDTQQLSEVADYILQWREGVVKVVIKLEEGEKAMKERLSEVEEGMRRWSEELQNVVDPDGRVHPPGLEEVKELWTDIKAWEKVLNSESEGFTGDTLLGKLEELQAISHLVEQWTEVSLEVLARHRAGQVGGADSTLSQEHQTMLDLNSQIDSTTRQCSTRLSGENGVAVGFIHLITPLETWNTKLNMFLSSNKKLSDSDWIKLKTLLGEWLAHVVRIIGYIGRVTTEKNQPVESTPMNELVVEVEKWRSAFTHSTDTQDHKINDTVTQMHSSLVLWMVQLLLASTATTHPPAEGGEEREGGGGGRGGGGREKEQGESGEERSGKELEDGERGEDEEEEEEEEEERPEEAGEDWEKGMGLTTVALTDLKADFTALSESLTSFTTSLTRTTTDIVEQSVGKRRQAGFADAEEEKRRLQRLESEAKEWAEQAALLLRAVAGGEEEREGGAREGEGGPEDSHMSRKSSAKASSDFEGVGEVKLQTSEAGEGELPKVMSVIGEDRNIHPKSLQQVIDETPPSVPPSPAELGLCTEQDLPEGRGAMPKDAEALVLALDQTKSKLEEQEEQTRQAEARAEAAEKELEGSRARVSELEAELQQLQNTLERAQSGRSTRGGGRGTGRKSRGGGGGGATTGKPPSRK